MKQVEIITHSESETRDIGHKLAKILPNGSVVCLLGDLGAGKTTLVRGVAEGLNIKEIVQSPTFNIMKIYLKGDRPLIHIDAYRLADFDSDIGLDEYIGYESGLTMIEWPMYIERFIPKEAVYVELKHINDDNRLISIKANDDRFFEGLK